ncbi:hypothetical protein [Pectinatus frisingensis]|uniref:hypothetical protein n=1 Tax=Pectinatus frisingensis TaxID=865 RepID=UPI0018C77A7C|nr:hypothetical protein [Pectinatus frisingensis]
MSGSPSNPANYTYYNSIIVKLDPGTLTPVSGGGPSASLAPNVFDLQYYGGSFYVTADPPRVTFQTPIKWNYTSRIQKVTTGLTVTDLVRPADSTETDPEYDNDKFDIRSLAILEDGTAYIINGSYDSNFAFKGHLWHANIADLTGDDLLSHTAQIISGVLTS